MLYRALRPISPQESGLFATILRGDSTCKARATATCVRRCPLRLPTTPPTAVAPPLAPLDSCLLFAHGLIHRVGRTNYHRPTQKGQQVMNTALKSRQTDFALLAA
jgi:hypothetical protein